MNETTWKDVVAAEVGHIFIDEFDENVRFLVLRSRASLCAYLGVPVGHPLAGFSCELLPIHAHGGLTYAGAGEGEMRPKDFYWYGWDYGHCDDYFIFYDDPKMAHIFTGDRHANETKWTPEMVKKDSWEAIYEFKALMKLTEAVAARSQAAKKEEPCPKTS